MAGYSGISMSNNACEAYSRGLLTASKIYKGLPAKLITKYCHSEEWHHSSAYYNVTSFYNPEYVKATFGIIQHEQFKFSEEAIQEWNEYRDEKKKDKIKKMNSEEVIFDNCVVKLGTKGFDKRIRRTETHGCRVVVKGDWCTINFPDGEQKRKKQGANYFEFYVEEK